MERFHVGESNVWTTANKISPSKSQKKQSICYAKGKLHVMVLLDLTLGSYYL